MTRISKRIVKAYRSYGFSSWIIIGPQGVGKTTYALKSLRDVYAEILGIDKNKAWEYALRFTFFKIQDAGDYIYTAVQQRKRIPALLFDDAGNWLSKYDWREVSLQSFFQFFNLARTVTAGIIFTTPSPNDIALYVREKSTHYVKITRSVPPNVRIIDKHGRNITEDVLRKYDAFAWFKAMSLGSDKRGAYIQKYTLTDVDAFTLTIPDWVRKRYEDKRYEALGDVSQSLVKNGKIVDLGF